MRLSKEASMLLGYCRVSTTDQSLDLQKDALAQAGCERIFEDQASGKKDDRVGLHEAIAFARKGDTLVVWRLDRLGRSLKGLIATVRQLEERGVELRSLHEQLDTASPGGRLIFHVFGALAEFEVGLLRERTKAGLASARAKGRVGGRRPKLSQEQKAEVVEAVQSGRRTQADMARLFGVDPATVSRIIARRT
jgi:DNA invertase Pin-like site-specific DNA recombinase